MQRTTVSTAWAVALLASAAVLAGSATAAASAQETTPTAAQEKCTPPALSPTDLSTGLASLLPKPGNAPPDPAKLHHHLREIDACARAAGITAPGEGDTSSAANGAAARSATTTQPASSTSP